MKVPVNCNDFSNLYDKLPECHKWFSKNGFVDFLLIVKSQIEYLNQSGKNLHSVKFRCYPLWCTCELDDTGELSFETADIYCGVDSDNGTLARQSFANDCGRTAIMDYTVIDIALPQKSDMKVCKWCGHLTKTDYCSAECREKDKNFKKTYSHIMQTWDEYKRLLSSDKDAAEELKNKSAYKHLLESGGLLVKVKLEHDSGLYAGLELQRRLRLPCLNCGGQIPDDKALQSRFCCAKCKSEYHNRKK